MGIVLNNPYIDSPQQEALSCKFLPSKCIGLVLEEVGAGGNNLLKNLALLQGVKGNFVLNVIADPSIYYLINQLWIAQSDNFLIIDAISLHQSTKTPTLIDIGLLLKEKRQFLSELLKGWQSEKKLEGKKREIFLFFWSLNPLFIYYNFNDVYQFLSGCVQQSIKYETKEFYLLQEGILSNPALKGLLKLFNLVWKLPFKKHKRKDRLKILEKE